MLTGARVRRTARFHLGNPEMSRDLPGERRVRRGDQHSPRSLFYAPPQVFQRGVAIRQESDVQAGGFGEAPLKEGPPAHRPERQAEDMQRMPADGLDQALERQGRSGQQGVERNGNPARVDRGHGK